MSKLQISPLLHFENSNEKYILNSINNQIFKVSPALDYWLRENGTESLNDENAIKSLKNSFVISDDMNNNLNDIYDAYSAEAKFEPVSISLLISQECNMRCSYCFADGGQYNNSGYMPYEVATKAIDIIVKNAKKINIKPVISFFGGEPLLNYNLMKQIVAYVKEKKYDVTYSMTTNGTLINKDVEQFILSNKIITVISIDGDEQTQDLNRYYANKKGSYKDVISATEHLRERGLLLARATITRDNPRYDTQILHLLSLGFRKVDWGYDVQTLTYENLNEMMNSFQNLCDKFYKLVFEENYQQAKKFGNIVRVLQRIHAATIRCSACGSGHSLMAVDIDGKIYPCHRFVNSKEYILGTVFQEYIERINEHKFYNECGIRNFAKCLSCVARNFCCGGCMYSNYSQTSNATEPPDITCQQSIEELKIAAKLYTNFSKEQLKNVLSI